MQELSTYVNGTLMYRLQVLGILPMALGHEMFWNPDPAYFDNIRIASTVLIVVGALITALPTRVYEVSLTYKIG